MDPSQREPNSPEELGMVEIEEELLRQWTTAFTAQATAGNETMGLLWGNRTAEGVKIEGILIPPHEAQTATECVVGDWDLIAAALWGQCSGDKTWAVGGWGGYIHTLIACEYCQRKTSAPPMRLGYTWGHSCRREEHQWPLSRAGSTEGAMGWSVP